MNKTILAGLLLFIGAGIAFGQTPATPPAQAPRGNPEPAPNLIQSCQEVLAYLPADLRRTKATAWTQVQRERANVAFKEALIARKPRAKFRLKVSDIAAWSGPGLMTLFSEIQMHDGYHVRVFGGFTDEWKPKLASLKKGDMVTLEGVVSSITYLDLWGQFTLSICMDDCKFTK